MTKSLRTLFLPFLAWLTFTASFAQNSIERGPYLQSGTPNRAIIKWRTSIATDSKVWYGNDPANLTQTEMVAGPFTDHEVLLSGLTDNTVYYYAIGNNSGQMAGADSTHYFKTAPMIGTSQPITAWVLGDCGTGNNRAREVRDAYYNYIGNNHTDMILLLGDNAYADGLDTEYQKGIFNMYPAKLKNTMMWSCPGNHDYYANTGLAADYYDIFSFPKNGEAGGLASNTEKYYSFDYGNIHIISLDSHDENRTPGSPMLTWLENDLAATLQDWVVVIFHHPPYSKASHDSDRPWETRMIQMRENVLPICEAYGVDLVLGGHSHAYERSKLIHGHYGFSSTYDPATHDVDGGDGRMNGNGGYQQDATEEGTVYIVTGSAGKLSPVGNHPVMYFSASQFGSTVLEVDGPVMDVKFLNRDGLVADYLTLTQNSLPKVRWAAPFKGQYFTDLDTIPFNVTATDTDGTIDKVKFFVNGDSVGVDEVAPYSFDWQPPVFANYVVKAMAVDNAGNSNYTEIVINVQNSPSINVSSQVINGGDDAEQRVSDGNMDVKGIGLQLGNDGATPQLVGLRFRNLNIPNAAIVTNAYIQFTTGEPDTVVSDITIKGEAGDNAPVFTTIPNDLSGRILTIDSINWSPLPWAVVGETDTSQQTPDLSGIVQEIVGRPGWEANNSMVFVVNGAGERTAASHNGNPAFAPVLHVAYELPGGNSFPTVDWVKPLDGQVFTDLSLDSLKATASDSDGNIAMVEFFANDVFVGVDSTAPFAVDWIPPTYGNYALKTVATDNKGSSSANEISIGVQNGTIHTLSIQINSGPDDAEEKEFTGEVNKNSSDLELVYDDWDNRMNQTVGMRFNGVDIPSGADITNAYIQFTVDETQTEATNLTIRGEAVDSAIVFEKVNYNISSRTMTTASVNWMPPGWTTVGAAGTDQQTPSLDGIVQEIIDRPGWKANNSMAFILMGTGERTAESYNGSPADAPVLHVTYYVGAGFCAPFADADADGYCSHYDCNDNDATIHPGVIETCNGVDNNCDGFPGAVINTWTGGGNNSLWTDPANWDNGIVPLPCQEVVLPSGHQVLIPANRIGVGKMLEVQMGAGLETAPSGEMDIKN